MQVRVLATLALSFLLLAGAGSAAPAKPPADPMVIDSYYGEWQGKATATSETDEDFPTTSRDIALSVGKSDLGGFVLSWSTLQRQKGNPKAPLEVTKSTSVEFVPAPQPNTWKSRAEVDPYSGGVLYWARLDGKGLTVSSFTINTDGKPEFQTYRRRLVGSDLRLEFTNVTDGRLVRTVKGSLRRVASR